MRSVVRILVCIFSLHVSLPLFAQNSGIIKGKVSSADGTQAGDVTILIKGTSRGTISDENGAFQFRRLPAGSYTLQASLMGFETVEQGVRVEEGGTATVSFQLRLSARELRSVVVTGSRKYRTGNVSPSLRLTTPILDLPQNIQVVTRGLIADQQSFDMLEGVQRNVSGAQKVEHWDNYARINMRGSQMTAFRNGMNVQMPWGPLTEDMSMVERIEFVKGPAGFMLANGEPGGFYNVVTKKPSGYSRGEVSFSLGSFDLYRATADVDGKLTKDGKLLYRLNLMGQLKGSRRNYEYNNRYSIVPVIKYLVDEKTSLTAEYTHQFSRMSAIGSGYAFSARGYADLPLNFTTAEPNLEPSNIQDRSLLVTLEHNLDEKWKLTAQAAYFNYQQTGQSIWPRGISKTNDSLMQRGVSIWDALGLNKTGQFFINGEASTGRIVHKLLGGIDMGHKDYYADWNQGALLGDSLFNIYHPVFGKVAAADVPVWDRSRSVRERGVRYNSSYNAFYLQDELAFFKNRLRLTLAGRYTANKYLNPYSGSTNDGKFTPRLGVSYSAGKNTSVYAVYDQAFIASPGTDWQGKNFDPVSGENLEAGIKKDWLGGKWNTALSVYQITRSNVLTADLEHPHPVTGQFTFRRQTGEQQTKGVEFDLRGLLTRNLEVVANYAFTEAVVTRDSDQKVVGNQVPGATRHIQNTWASYRIHSGKLSGLKFSLGGQYQAGRSSWYVFDGSEQSLPDYFRLDGGVSWQGEQLGVQWNVNNILNEYLYSGAPYGGMYYWQTEAGINTRVTVSYKF